MTTAEWWETLEVWEDNSKLKPNKLRKIYSINMVNQGVGKGVLRHAESKFGLGFVQALLHHMDLSIFV